MTDDIGALLPPLRTEEQEALEASIKEVGIIVPVIVDENGFVLDGHHRAKFAKKHKKEIPSVVRAGLSEAEKQAFAIEANLARRNLSPEQRRELKKVVKSIAVALKREGKSQKQIASALGVAQQTVSTWLDATNTKSGNGCIPDGRVSVPREARPAVAARAEAGEAQAQIAADFGVSRQAISKIVKKHEEKKTRDAKAAETPAPAWVGEWQLPGIYVADCTDPIFIESLPKDCADLIFTDPPWGEAAFADGSWEGLATVAGRILKPGGLLVSYVGQMFMYDAMSILGTRLLYRWCAAIGQKTSDTRMKIYNLFVNWRPVLIYEKDGAWPKTRAVSDFAESARDKAYHEWGQDWRPAKQWIDAFTEPGQTVCDPFCGGGAFLYAAKILGRQWIGFDREEAAAVIALQRLMGGPDARSQERKK